MSTSAAKSSVLLDFYKTEYNDGLRSFYLPDEQLQFSALPHEVLTAAAQDPHRYPVVILADSKPVGFLSYTTAKKSPYTRTTRRLSY